MKLHRLVALVGALGTSCSAQETPTSVLASCTEMRAGLTSFIIAEPPQQVLGMIGKGKLGALYTSGANWKLVESNGDELVVRVTSEGRETTIRAGLVPVEGEKVISPVCGPGVVRVSYAIMDGFDYPPDIFGDMALEAYAERN